MDAGLLPGHRLLDRPDDVASDPLRSLWVESRHYPVSGKRFGAGKSRLQRVGQGTASRSFRGAQCLWNLSMHRACCWRRMSALGGKRTFG